MRVPSTITRWGVWLLLVGVGGCVDPYTPEVITAPTSFLVVDGFVNGNGTTRIKLSRTQNLAASTTPPPPETKASLTIVSATGARYAVRERSPGFYQSDSLTLAPGQYQLRIATAGASPATYESDLVPLKATPPIDNLSWRLKSNQLQVLLSTHDATQQARYYRWKFSETWEFNANYKSFLEYYPSTKEVTARTTPIYTCWRTEQPTTIKQATTAQLSQDALVEQDVLDIGDRAERLKIRYSVLVTQYAQTAEEFAYYEQLRKNTEAVGTVNDPLPTQLTGNVHRTGAATNEPVLGYVGAHTVQQQRLFIDRAELPLPPTWAFESGVPGCTLFQEDLELYKLFRPPLYLHVPQTITFADPNYVPTDYYFDSSTGAMTGYYGASRECVDCRMRGSITKPSFW
jgi:hypothetical protein